MNTESGPAMQPKRRRKRRQIVFIDTNIYLDFYRARNEVGLKLLNHVSTVREDIISTYQVEMEFEKNRQSVILESSSAMKSPETISQPAFLAEAASVIALKKNVEDVKQRVKVLRARLKTILTNPTSQDPVYKLVHQIFSEDKQCSLTREKKVRDKIRRLALKRFALGYPPRKRSDTSIGDAVNWEWVVACAVATGADVIIVSRDSDYGVTVDDESFLNDWLRREFKNRVSRRRQIRLTHKLSQALKWLSVKVTKAEVAEESRAVAPMKIVRSVNSELTTVGETCALCRMQFTDSVRATMRHHNGHFILLCPNCSDVIETNAGER